MLLADYVAVDESSKKAQVVGGGIAILGVNSRTGMSAPFGVLVIIEVPSSLYGAECTIEITLEDAAGVIVLVPVAGQYYSPGFLLRGTAARCGILLAMLRRPGAVPGSGAIGRVPGGVVARCSRCSGRSRARMP